MRRYLLLWMIPLLMACGSPGTAAKPNQPPPASTPTAAFAATDTVPPVPPTEVESPTPTALPIPSFPDPANYTWATIADGIQRPVDLQNAGDKSGRLFILTQSGRILV